MNRSANKKYNSSSDGYFSGSIFMQAHIFHPQLIHMFMDEGEHAHVRM